MISAGRGVTMELEIILVFHCNPCQFILKKSLGGMDAGIGEGGGGASPKSEIRRGRSLEKKTFA